MINWRREAKRYDWWGKGQDLPKSLIYKIEELPPFLFIQDEAPIAFIYDPGVYHNIVKFYTGRVEVRNGYKHVTFNDQPFVEFLLDNNTDSALVNNIKVLMGKR